MPSKTKTYYKKMTSREVTMNELMEILQEVGGKYDKTVLKLKEEVEKSFRNTKCLSKQIGKFDSYIIYLVV
jgi:uncharacterized protein with gpF-like domain